MLKESLQVLKYLADSKLLLKQAKSMPNVVTLLTGERLSGSWWSHPKSHLIFRVLSEVVDHRDVLVTKLLSGKDTFIHRDVWPALLGVVSSKEGWQMRGLSGPGKKLLKCVEEKGIAQQSGPVAKELLARLLVYSEEVHTKSGKHVLQLESWAHWARRKKVKLTLSPGEGRALLDQTALRIGAPQRLLPWA
ncbi:MAG: hypothetical protein PHX83_02410 [Acidobacteriia bacterium]|nr:hypothetical protein [Terriglobia bacterium]